jgi:dihydroorotate dehydrogenase (NAD+) catalytic subunit
VNTSLTVRIGSLTLPNPVGVASGCFGYGQEYAELIDLDSLGALYTKAVTLEPRAGNPPPRLVETSCGLINSIGLANPGLKAFLSDKLPTLARLRCPVIVNIAGSTKADYESVVAGIEAAVESQPYAGSKAVDGYEINVSCPNVDHGGMSFGTEPSIVESLTASLRRLTKRPLIVKLSPNVTDIALIARAAESGGADALSCINTLVGMSIDTETCSPRLPRGTGGLSGPAIRPVGVACVWKVSRAVSIPVIGLGGIGTGRDAIEYLLAGASAIQVGTALFADPRAPAQVLAGIAEWMRARSLGSVGDIRKLLRA